MKTYRNTIWAAVAGAALLCAASARGAVISFADSEFLNADWLAFEVNDQTPNDSFSFSATQLGAGGNPGAYRQVINELNTLVGSQIASGHLFQGGGFDPGVDGPFKSLAMSFDGISIPGNPAGAMGYGVLLEQGGDFFSHGLGQVLDGLGFAALSATGLTEADFTPFDGGVLDLTDTGAPVSIGFFVSNGTFGQPSTNEGGVDNWSVSITTGVPEPGLAGLLGFGLFALGYLRKRRRA